MNFPLFGIIVIVRLIFHNNSRKLDFLFLRLFKTYVSFGKVFKDSFITLILNHSFILIIEKNLNSIQIPHPNTLFKIIQPNLLFHLLYQNSRCIKSVDPHVQSSEAKIIQFNPEPGATASNKPGDPLMSSSLPSSWRGSFSRQTSRRLRGGSERTISGLRASAHLRQESILLFCIHYQPA